MRLDTAGAFSQKVCFEHNRATYIPKISPSAACKVSICFPSVVLTQAQFSDFANKWVQSSQFSQWQCQLHSWSEPMSPLSSLSLCYPASQRGGEHANRLGRITSQSLSKDCGNMSFLLKSSKWVRWVNIDRLSRVVQAALQFPTLGSHCVLSLSVHFFPLAWSEDPLTHSFTL